MKVKKLDHIINPAAATEYKGRFIRQIKSVPKCVLLLIILHNFILEEKETCSLENTLGYTFWYILSIFEPLLYLTDFSD